MSTRTRGLEHLRRRLGESQREVAEALGVSPKSYSHFERRRRRPRDLKLLLRMAEHFGVSVEEIIWHLDSDLDSDDEEERYSSPQATSTA